MRAVAAGLATLRQLQKPGVYERLEELSSWLEDGLKVAALRTGAPVRINRVGSMFTVFFTSTPVTDFVSARTSDTGRYGRFFHALLDRGVYLAPSQFEACFVSLAHSRRVIDATIRAVREALEIAIQS